LFFSRSHPVRRPLVNRVVRAFTEAIHYIKTNKEETKALIGKNLKSNDPGGLERAYLVYNAAYLEVLYPSAERVKTLLDDIAPRTQKPRQRFQEFGRYEFRPGTGEVGIIKQYIKGESRRQSMRRIR
jgi:hypothetical protein